MYIIQDTLKHLYAFVCFIPLSNSFVIVRSHVRFGSNLGYPV